MPVRKDRAADRVLIIEGTLARGSELAPPLIAAGFSVARIPYYSEAVLALVSLKPDIILMDQTLTDSAEVYQRIRSALDAPVIAIGEDCHGETWAKAMPGTIRHGGPGHIDLIQRLTAALEEV